MSVIELLSRTRLTVDTVARRCAFMSPRRLTTPPHTLPRARAVEPCKHIRNVMIRPSIRSYPVSNVVPPDTEARFRVSDSHALAIVSVPATAVDQLFEQSGIRSPNPFGRFHGSVMPAPEAALLLDAMWQASESGGPAANLWLDGLTLQLLAILANEHAMSPVADDAADKIGLRRAIDYLESYLDTALTLSELARAASMEEARFARAFRATTGQTVWAYVEVRRRERARLLCEANATVLLSAPRIGNGDRRLVRAEDYIEAHLGTPLTVGDLAEVATMSRSGFARAFRNARGESVWSYVQGRRAARALEMLAGSRVPIAQIAERCGFASQSHLTSVLRQRYGVTPGAVRRG